MDIHYTAAEVAFREEVRTFLRESLSAAVIERGRNGKHFNKEDYSEWMRKVGARGWLGASWPVEFGGTGWTAVQKMIFEDECAIAGAPWIIPFGLKMLAPVLIKFGTEQQKTRFLKRILDCEDWWVQGYSEPGAGSDLAAVKTRAVREGDVYVVNGQKTWTSYAQYADWIFCLVRTDPQAQLQRGISFLLIDMKAPGITVRPIITLDGKYSVNEVFFDNVRVPVENLVGEENKGWTCAKYLLTHERTALAGIGESKAKLMHLKEVARREQSDGKRLIDDPQFRAQIADVEIQLLTLEMCNLRALVDSDEGAASGGESSMLKIRGTEIRQAISFLISKAAGPYSMPYLEDELGYDSVESLLHTDYTSTATTQYLDMRKSSVFGGSNEIQKNIIAKTVLEL